MKRQLKKTLLGIFLIILPDILNAEIVFPVFKKMVCTVEINKKKPEELYLDIADTEQKRSYGLMNRVDMNSNSGMLFIWKDRKIRNFWMKNTHFNLDLFFLNDQGEIVEIYKNARAFDKKKIKSKNKVNYVVELKSGKYPLLVGDKFKCPFENN